MRVALVGSLERGGPADLVADLASALAEHTEIEVRVFAPPPARGGAHRLEGLLEPLRIDSKRAILDARRTVAAWRPDVVHAHDRRASLVAAAFRTRADGPARVLTYHGVPDDVSQPWFSGERGAVAPSRYTRATLAADAVVLRALDAIVVPSSAMAGFLRDRLRAPADRVRHIENGLRLPPPRPGRGPARLLLFAGLLVERKGLRDLIDALGRPGVMPTDARLLVAGDGPELGAIERQLAGSGLAERVEMLGFRSDIPELLERVDALVLPSRMEQQPLALIEAMAAGKQILATRCGGIPEMLKDLPALIAEPHDVDDLARALQELFADPDPATAGRLLAKRAHATFSVEGAVSAHRALYAGLLQGRSSAECTRARPALPPATDLGTRDP